MLLKPVPLILSLILLLAACPASSADTTGDTGNVTSLPTLRPALSSGPNSTPVEFLTPPQLDGFDGKWTTPPVISTDGLSPSKPFTIIGLHSVSKRGLLHHYWHYLVKASDGEEHIWTSLDKIKGIKDLREYAQVHPKRFAFQQWSNRWQSSFSVGGSILGAASSGLLTGILFKH